MSEWISVEDKFPNDEVILFHPFERVDGTPDFIIFVGYWDVLNDKWVCGWSSMFPPFKSIYTQNLIDQNFILEKNEVKYWMPLPNPPK